MTQRIRGVIFDIDGTLVNSNDAHARSWLAALAEADTSVRFEQVRKLIGMGADKLLPALASISEDSALGTRISRRRGEIFRNEYLPKLQPFPQVRALLSRLREKGLSLAVASSAQRQELEALLHLAKVQDLLEGAGSSSEAGNSKPDPDIVQAALERLQLSPERVLMIGDTPYDIEAATRAGMGSIAFRCGGRSDAELAGAVAIYDGPSDLLEHLETSALLS
jgi:HAD superfamily hydrolase (TIGR01509 family)